LKHLRKNLLKYQQTHHLETNKSTNKETEKRTNKKTNKGTNSSTNSSTNKDTNEGTNKRTNQHHIVLSNKDRAQRSYLKKVKSKESMAA
jgi:hypothetical protein